MERDIGAKDLFDALNELVHTDFKEFTSLEFRKKHGIFNLGQYFSFLKQQTNGNNMYPSDWKQMKNCFYWFEMKLINSGYGKFHEPEFPWEKLLSNLDNPSYANIISYHFEDYEIEWIKKLFIRILDIRTNPIYEKFK
jgi:hypothetical protein